MIHLNNKTLFSIVICFCCIATSAQTFRDSLSSFQMKRENTSGNKPKDFTPVFKPTVKTEAVKIEKSNSIIDTKDVRVFPSPNIQSEVHISINKTNPDNLVASANTLLGVKFGKRIYNQGFYYTNDGGKTWSGADFLQSAPFHQVFGDPSTAFTADGVAYLTTLTNGGYLFQRSVTGGSTWSHAVFGTNDFYSFGFDKPMIAADNKKTSPYANNFYQTWTDFSFGSGEVLFNRSTDYGKTFSIPIIIRNLATGFGQGTNVQTGPGGEVYVCWAEHAALIFPYAADGLGFTKSTDGGATFETYKKAFDYTGTRVFGFDSTYNYTRINDFPSMAVDKSSGSYHGRIYVAYPTKQRDTGKSIIEVRYSSNKGNSWSDPVKVSIGKGRQNYFPWIAVDDATGDVWVVYYSIDEPKGFSTNTYVALSRDGGATWQNKKVSDVPHKTAAIDNDNFAFGYAGDYIGITAYGGKAYPIWQDDRNGTWQIYCSPVSVNEMAKTQESPAVSAASLANDLSVAPNPFKNVVQLNLKNETATSVQLVNQSGIIIKQWNNVTSNTLNIGDIPKGVYVIKVVGNGNKIYMQKLLKE